MKYTRENISGINVCKTDSAIDPLIRRL